MALTLKQAGEAAKSALSIYGVMALLAAGVVIAGDYRYLQKVAGGQITLQVKVDRLSEDIEELVLEKRFETDPAKIKKLDAYIEYKEKKRAAEVQKYELSK